MKYDISDCAYARLRRETETPSEGAYNNRFLYFCLVRHKSPRSSDVIVPAKCAEAEEFRAATQLQLCDLREQTRKKERRLEKEKPCPSVTVASYCLLV